MEEVPVHDDENEDIHYIKGSFLGANKTLRGRRAIAKHLNKTS